MTGSAGDVDYGRIGTGYAARRRADASIARQVRAALGPARTLVNVGAGAGSYEPGDLSVVAVEPSPSMVGQRPPGAAPCVRAVAGALPMATGSVDAGLASVTLHQWPDPAAGLDELLRVATGPVAVLTFDPDRIHGFWLAEYVPELFVAEAGRYPTIAWLAAFLGPGARIESVPVPLDCTDGFTEAFYGRPEAFLDPEVRRSQSAWAFVDPEVADRGLARLGADLTTGRWDARRGRLRTQPSYDGAIRLVTGRPSIPAGHG